MGQKESDLGRPRPESRPRVQHTLAIPGRRVRLRSRTAVRSEPHPSLHRPRSIRSAADRLCPSGLLPVSEAVSTLTGSDQVLQGPW